MQSVIEKFIENAEVNDDMSVLTGTETKRVREAPDRLSNSINRMGKTLTEAKEAPDRAFIPKRRF